MFCLLTNYNAGVIIITPQGKSDKITWQEGKGMEHSLTATEAARLIDWLIEHGHSAEDATQCIKYIATGIKPEGK